MKFAAGSGKINIDLIYSGLKRLPDEGEELYSDSFGVYLGGGAPGTLINLAGLGIPSVLVTSFGNDMFSAFAMAEAKKSGLKIINIYDGKGFAPNISTAILTPKDRTFISYGEPFPAGDNKLQAVYDACKGAAYVIMEEGEEYFPVYKKLKSEGSKLVMDFGWKENLSIENYRGCFGLADYYLPNRKEALAVTGTGDYIEAAKVLSGYFPETVIKLDSQGVYIFSEGKGEIIKSADGFNHVDSTGAGDAFLAGFLYGLIKGYGLKKAALCGNLTGGKCVTGFGCLTERFSGAEIEEYLAKTENF